LSRSYRRLLSWPSLVGSQFTDSSAVITRKRNPVPLAPFFQCILMVFPNATFAALGRDRQLFRTQEVAPRGSHEIDEKRRKMKGTEEKAGAVGPSGTRIETSITALALNRTKGRLLHALRSCASLKPPVDFRARPPPHCSPRLRNFVQFPLFPGWWTYNLKTCCHFVAPCTQRGEARGDAGHVRDPTERPQRDSHG
jgi:hypothetical protein